MNSLPTFCFDKASHSPLHRQVEKWLRLQIETGSLAPGAALPARKEFCEMLGGINHLTIGKAVSSLIRDGLLFSVQGRGTYVADKKAAALSIGLVLPCVDNENHRRIADGVQEYFDDLRKKGGPVVRAVLFDSRRDVEKEIENIAHLEDLPLDGAIVYPLSSSRMTEHLVRLKASNFPLVVIGGVTGLEFNSVCSDDYTGSYAVTKYLLEKGRRRLAWVGDMSVMTRPAARRVDGFRDAICDFGLPFDRKLIRNYTNPSFLGPFEPFLFAVLDQLLSESSLPDALVCCSDADALFALKMLQQRGVRVPQDISVVGFDDLKGAAVSEPPLTTVYNPFLKTGNETAKLLMKHMDTASEEIENVILPVELIIRGSA